jgi:predicted HD phosphohydrolase
MATMTVSYSKLTEMTAEDAAKWVAYDEAEEPAVFPDRILAAVADMNNSRELLQVGRLDHSLQSATRAYRDGRGEQYTVAALVHDLGDSLAPFSAGAYAAAILKPFVDERICWIVDHHEVFTLYYYAHFFGGDRNARDMYRDHPYYDDGVEFSELYDQNCFDPEYDALPLEFFRSMVHRIFGEVRFPPEGRSYVADGHGRSRP